MALSCFKSWFIRTVALMVAWGILLVIAAAVGAICGYRVWLFLVFWLWAGLFQMLLKPGHGPLPCGDSVDILGALAMLWWAARWPIRLLKK